MVSPRAKTPSLNTSGRSPGLKRRADLPATPADRRGQNGLPAGRSLGPPRRDNSGRARRETQRHRRRPARRPGCDCPRSPTENRTPSRRRAVRRSGVRLRAPAGCCRSRRGCGAADAILLERVARRADDLGMSLQAEVAGSREIKISLAVKTDLAPGGPCIRGPSNEFMERKPARFLLRQPAGVLLRRPAQFLLKPTALAIAIGRPKGFLMNFLRHSGQRSKRSC